MKTLGLTGGIGMGKSACAQLLAARGIPVVDTDDLARQVVEPGQPALVEIRRVFGPEVVGADGALRRDKLARRVFADPASRKQLESLLHPAIRQLWQTRVAAWQAKGHEVAGIVIPLLFETHAQSDLDTTLCVACSAATQHERLLARGWLPDQIEQRLRAQWPIETKMTLADYVLWTEAGFDLLTAQLDRIFEAIGQSPPG